MRHFGLLCVCVAALASACSDDKDDQNTNPLNPGGGTGGTTNAVAGSGGAGGASGGAGGAGGGNSEGGQPSGIAGSAQAPDNNGNGGAPAAGGDAGVVLPPGDAGADASMSFFVTSRGGPDGGNFGGLEGADALCLTLATAANPALASKTWRAYLSTSTVDARDRIGAGPWRNFNGVIIANDIEQLHDQGAQMGQGGTLDQTWIPGSLEIPLDETGAQVPSGGGNVLHDILTGTNLDGTANANTCNDWTSSATTVTTVNGHSNRAGGGQAPASWNSAHATGCAPSTQNFQQGTVSQGGGRGSIYCFAAD